MIEVNTTNGERVSFAKRLLFFAAKVSRNKRLCVSVFVCG
jgi:hypothetical protein